MVGCPWALCLLLALTTVSMAAPHAGLFATAHGGEAAGPITESNGPRAAGGSPATPGTGGIAGAPAAAGATVLESKGYVIAAHQIQVSPIEVSGLIKELYDRGRQTVQEGRRAGRPGQDQLRGRRGRRRASLASAEAKLLKLRNGYRDEDKRAARHDMEAAEADLVQAKADFIRIDELYNKGPGVSVTKTDWDAARANRDRALRRYEASQARYDMTMNGSRVEEIDEAAADVDVAKARLRKAEWRLDNCTIRAPIDGTILTKKAELGNLVNPLAFGATSGAVCEMADLADLEVELDITERDYRKGAKRACPATSGRKPTRTGPMTASWTGSCRSPTGPKARCRCG